MVKYMGGKQTIGKEVAAFIQKDTIYDSYFEPFCGFLGVGRHIISSNYLFNDIHPDLILFLRELKTFSFPDITEEYYTFLKISKPSAIRGYAGFCLSFGGKFFGGFSSKYGEKNYHREAENSCRKLQKDLQSKQITFENKSYEEFEPHHTTIYADPPYRNTTSYAAEFNSDQFWKTMEKWSVDNDVYVSEYEAPEGWECVWEKEKRMTLSKKKTTRIEKLFKFNVEKKLL